ncbi:phosphoglycerol transferase MdoB-like AlkP superfamily enzyme [Dysgonomonas sp. PFB1-18]|uniref:LTA synthase family protein n=1 Tax=unclassified Dysgonomonas TaxID=2630389 RepID=UPI0024740EB7|nr:MULTISPECIES: alkaline phosphatase family protein [unclassified Dysgonomonas]MDH6307272.1 phosphoglycerol transferase MdoB-like AlkP superfamily enzyme [Dysgonomonas sp. PF1-14]MDH6337190.1 phosphoglycerol transferase MdoB-like AlkP superfamily enzyme [Dysgonomonas sp. PF1-16]MDH6379114.1 phosphoglycerol transferase MdoB-like AlkP superfamily enzyme [Dysgonomonas sp. PFB1-18]MDH6396249.1 phosphoglycerol transferase MdoB-like AlkP superfamily enzyme [Dysgonomonas sp. PF1-23]
MKERILLFVSIFFYFILIFLIGKTAFMLIHCSIGGGVTGGDIVTVLYHGLPLDLSMSGYLTVIPALVLIVSIWLKPKFIAKIYNVYYVIILAVIAIITVSDIVVYPYWGFHFDSTVFLYLQNPKESFASASALEIALGIVSTIILAVILFVGYIFIVRKQVLNLQVPKSIGKTFIALILLTGVLFLPIRGGVTVSTMNIGKVYFSENMFLNHAAINPEFNLMASFFKSDNFGTQYQFYDKQEAENIFATLTKQPATDSLPQLLNTEKPNIILFILESFSSDAAMDSIVAPNMHQFAKEGIFFSNFYANSFRTDRGLVSILSGYPAHPTVAIMKYPQKTESLPTISRSLKNSGYKNLSFYYGGDADFANMRSYFVGACGISDVVSDKDFPLSERMTKWGAPDKFVIDRAYNDLTHNKQDTPFLKTILTLSSHEPFDVPVTKFKEPFLNAVNYTDECLGSFVRQLKTKELWNNTLIILIADHAMQGYPKGLSNSDPERFRIPMIWMGGAVKQPAIIEDYGSQNDLAATLLSQLNIKHDDFRFSKDMLNPEGRKFAFYSYVNGFCMTDSTGTVTYDNDKQSIINQSGNPELGKQAKAFFQNMYMDLGNR